MSVLKGKVAIVTGGSRGIGEMITAGFLANGAKVYISARKAPALMEKAKELSERYNGECIAIPCDLSNTDGMDYFVQQISENEKGIDYLINNAGAAWGEPLEDFSETGWDKVMDLNVKSIFFLTQKLKSLLKTNATIDDPSRVINIGSIDGLNVPALPTFSYSASKAGVIALTKSLGKELALKNIAVNCVTPAAAKTRIFEQITQKHIDYMLYKIPRNRFVKVEELASLVAWLASEENSFTTAGVFDLSGGRATY